MRGFTEESQQILADEQKSMANKGRKGLGFGGSSKKTANGALTPMSFVPAGHKPTPPPALNKRKKIWR
jgi:hypothetical protein